TDDRMLAVCHPVGTWPGVRRGARLPLSRRILRASWAPTTVRGRCWPGWRKTRHPAARGLWHRVCTLPGATEEHEHQTWRQARRDGAPLPLPVAHVRALAQQHAASGPRDGGRKGRETMTKQEPVSPRTAATQSRLRGAEVTQSVCPYCAIGCGLLVFTKAAKIIAIEGNPESPVNEGRLCPKGANTLQLVANPHRVTTVKYRAP